MSANTSGFHPQRHDQLRPELIHDSYRLTRKPVGGTVCRECGAVFHAGRWVWSERPTVSHETLCPACQRVRDRLPAGFVHVGGSYFKQKREELLRLLLHREEREKAEHPLARIIAIEVDDDDEGLRLTTTDIHLARALGEALFSAHRGKLEFDYNEGENLLRVDWSR